MGDDVTTMAADKRDTVDVDLSVDVGAVINPTNLSTPGAVFGDLLTQDDALVITPQGLVLHNYDSHAPWHSVAEEWAKQNGALYFPAKKDGEYVSVPLEDIAKAMRWTAVNLEPDHSLRGHPGMQEGAAASDLFGDAIYLDRVRRATKPGIHGPNVEEALEGTVTWRGASTFGEGDGRYNVRLSMGLNKAAGYEEFLIVGRRLQAKLCSAPGWETDDTRTELQLQAARQYAHKQNMHLRWGKEEPVQEVMLTWESPMGYLTFSDPRDRQCVQYEETTRLTVPQMIPSFLGVASSLSKTFVQCRDKGREARETAAEEFGRDILANSETHSNV